MKRLLFVLLLGGLSQLLFSQTNFLQRKKSYFENNITKLDPIEGVFEWESHSYASFRGRSQSQKWDGVSVITKLSGNEFIVTDNYGNDDGRRIRRIGDSNWYTITFKDGNGSLCKKKFQLDGTTFSFGDDEYFSNGLRSSNNTTFIKSYPTKRMYAEAIKKKAEKEAAIELPQNWTGTGFALNNSYVVTNYHVIENAKKITLKGINGNFSTQYTASVAASDKKNDLALLKLNGNVSITNIPYSVSITTSDVGEEVFVLGYPLTATMGDEIKLTTGVISSKSGFQGDISQYQISAPVQPGNSGGPLFDSKGNVIGIVSAKHVGAENVGYAIKTSYLKSLVESVTSANVFPQTNKVATQNLSGKVKAVKNYVFYITCSR